MSERMQEGEEGRRERDAHSYSTAHLQHPLQVLRARLEDLREVLELPTHAVAPLQIGDWPRPPTASAFASGG